jgi:hypothetical protein
VEGKNHRFYLLEAKRRGGGEVQNEFDGPKMSNEALPYINTPNQ